MLITISIFLTLGFSLATVNHLVGLDFQLQGYLQNKYAIKIDYPIFFPFDMLFL
jgi:hypothetical protein